MEKGGKQPAHSFGRYDQVEQVEQVINRNFVDTGELSGMKRIEIQVPDGISIAKGFLAATDDMPEAAQS